MAYQNNIPQPTNRLKDSQQDLLDNFIAIKQLIDVNHSTFGSATEGKHPFIEFPTATPTLNTLTTPEVALYSKVGAVSGVPELYFQRNNLAADMGYSITEATLNSNGWTRLPSGLLIKWGTGTVPRNPSNPCPFSSEVTFPSGGSIPVFTAVFCIVGNQTFTCPIGENQLNTSLAIGNFSTTKFSVLARANGLPNNGNVSMNYFAIGM